MSRLALIIMSTLVIFMSCNRNISKSEVSKTLYDFDFKIIPGKTYLIESENDSNGPSGLKKFQFSYSVHSKDSNEVVVKLENLKIDVESESVRESLEKYKISTDSIKQKGPAFVKIKTLKEIEKNDFKGKNKNSATQTIGGIALWNQQMELPQGQLMIHDSISILGSNKYTNRSTKTVFTLNDVKNNIAFFSFTKYDLNENNPRNNRLPFSVQSRKTGFLEYDLQHNYYRYIENIVGQTTNMKFETPEENDPDKLPSSTTFTNKSIVKISVLE